MPTNTPEKEQIEAPTHPKSPPQTGFSKHRSRELGLDSPPGQLPHTALLDDTLCQTKMPTNTPEKEQIKAPTHLRNTPQESPQTIYGRAIRHTLVATPGTHPRPSPQAGFSKASMCYAMRMITPQAVPSDRLLKGFNVLRYADDNTPGRPLRQASQRLQRYAMRMITPQASEPPAPAFSKLGIQSRALRRPYFALFCLKWFVLPGSSRRADFHLPPGISRHFSSIPRRSSGL